MNKSSLADAITEVRAIYQELAARPIERNCIGRAECCHFKLTGLTPYLTKGEAIVAAKAWRATGRKQLPQPADGSCPMLDPQTARCLIYRDRPFGCRLIFAQRLAARTNAATSSISSAASRRSTPNSTAKALAVCPSR